MSSEDPRHDSWGHRHAISIMTTVMFALLVLVIVVQVAC